VPVSRAALLRAARSGKPVAVDVPPGDEPAVESTEPYR
jgi:hypothetical protein